MPKISVVITSHNRLSSSKQATGDFVAFLDDDLFLPNKISCLKSVLKNEDRDLITSFATVDIAGRYQYTIRPNKAATYEKQLIRNLVGTTSMVTVRKSAFLDSGMFNESMPARQDYEAWLRMLKNHASYYCIPKKLVTINSNFQKKSVSRSIENNLKGIELIEQEYREDIDNLNWLEKRTRAAALDEFVAHKYLITGDNFKAAKYFFSSYKRNKNIKIMMATLLSLFGRNCFLVYFKLYK